MMRFRTTILALLLGLGACSGEDRIVIGSKNFSEQVILGELVAQYLEAATGLDVDRRLNLGGTSICHEGLVAGQLDIYVEYTGTALTAILGEPPLGDPDAVLDRVRRAYDERFDVEWMDPLGFDNTFAMIVRGSDARGLDLETISDAVPYASAWTIGFGYEFAEREDGYRGLASAYGLEFDGPPREMDLGLVYQALADGQVDMIAGNSTDGLIGVLDLHILDDDRGYFPPYEAVPLVRQETLERHPGIAEALGRLAGAISGEEMRAMNYRVDGEREDVRRVVSEFLESKNLGGR